MELLALLLLTAPISCRAAQADAPAALEARVSAAAPDPTTTADTSAKPKKIKAPKKASDVLAGVLMAVLLSVMIFVYAEAIFRGRERPAAPDKHEHADGAQPPKKEPPRDT